MKNTKLYSFILFAFLFVAFISCENDFAEINSDIVGGDNFTTQSETFPLTTFNRRLSPVQTNGLPNYLLGHFNDPAYGGSSASIVAQLGPSDGEFPIEFDQFFNIQTVLDSIILTIPYFSNSTGIDENNLTEFDTDSIFGNGRIKISVHQNNFLIRDFDPSDPFNPLGQVFFSNGSTSQNEIIPPSQLEGEVLFEDNNFLIDPNPIVLFSRDPITNELIPSTLLAPSLRLKLNNPNNFWQNLLFSRQGQPELSNSNNFNNHFRGLYIKAQSIATNGSMALLNILSENSNVEFFFSTQSIDNEGNVENEMSSFTLDFNGNIVNIFENNFIPIPQGDEENGDSQLFLKGGEGSMAIINLFNGDSLGNSDELTSFKSNFRNPDGSVKRLINDAFLEFQVDQSVVTGEEPNRVLIFDINNNSLLTDFTLDPTLEARSIHLPPLIRENNDPKGNGTLYRIRITNHINNILLRDSTNVKLGLVVTSSVDDQSSIILPTQEQEQLIQGVPQGSILSPRGTVLFGNNALDESKRPVFRIFFTEPTNQ